MCQWTLPEEGIEGARAAADRAFAIEPGLPEAHNAIGALQHRIEWDFESAEMNFRVAAEAPHEVPFVHWLYSELLLNHRRFEDARQAMDRALQFNPYNTFVMSLKANLDMLEGEAESAEEILEHGVEVGPGDPWIRAKLGVMRCWQGRHSEGLELLEEAYEASPDDPFIIGDLGWCNGLAGRRENALELDRLLEERAARGEVYVDPGSRAAIALGLGQHDLMFEHLNRAVEIRASSLTFMIANDYRFQALDADERFGEIMRRVGLPY
jgi:Flp pilus assembly protein TadD